MTERDRARDIAAVLSKEYQAALAAQIDYDSTSEGQKKIDDELAITTDPKRRRHLIARKMAGVHSHVARGEQVAFMPQQTRKRGQEGWPAYKALGKARERLAREYGCAAAEANAWSQVSPMTIAAVFDLFTEIRGYEEELGEDLVLWRHPDLFARSNARAPWLGTPHTREVTVGDVIKLVALGMEAVYRNGRVYATGNPDAAFRWGYLAQIDGQVAVFTQAPDLRAWDRARKKKSKAA